MRVVIYLVSDDDLYEFIKIYLSGLQNKRPKDKRRWSFGKTADIESAEANVNSVKQDKKLGPIDRAQSKTDEFQDDAQPTLALGLSKEEQLAAIRIQTAFRGYLVSTVICPQFLAFSNVHFLRKI